MNSGYRARTTGMLAGLLLAGTLAPAALAIDNQSPDGFHDGNQGVVPRGECWAAGWAVDPDSPSERVNVRILVDGTELVTVQADQFRQDLLDAGVSPDGYSSFFVYMGPLGIGFDAWHTVVTEAQDVQTSEWRTLNDSARSIFCSNAGGFHDGNTGLASKADCIATGWATDWDTPGTAVAVRVKVDGKVVADTLASEFRDSPDPAVLPDGPYGFTVKLFGKVTPNVAHTITLEMRDTSSKRLWIRLFETDKVLTCSPTAAAGPA